MYQFLRTTHSTGDRKGGEKGMRFNRDFCDEPPQNERINTLEGWNVVED